jgi:hypothetical protein
MHGLGQIFQLQKFQSRKGASGEKPSSVAQQHNVGGGPVMPLEVYKARWGDDRPDGENRSLTNEEFSISLASLANLGDLNDDSEDNLDTLCCPTVAKSPYSEESLMEQVRYNKRILTAILEVDEPSDASDDKDC